MKRAGSSVERCLSMKPNLFKYLEKVAEQEAIGELDDEEMTPEEREALELERIRKEKAELALIACKFATPGIVGSWGYNPFIKNSDTREKEMARDLKRLTRGDPEMEKEIMDRSWQYLIDNFGPQFCSRGLDEHWIELKDMVFEKTGRVLPIGPRTGPTTPIFKGSILSADERAEYQALAEKAWNNGYTYVNHPHDGLATGTYYKGVLQKKDGGK